MYRNREQVDEHILAAYLSGDLPSSLRREIASYIVKNDDALDLMSMANDAMNTSDSGDGASVPSDPVVPIPLHTNWYQSEADVRRDAEKTKAVSGITGTAFVF